MNINNKNNRILKAALYYYEKLELSIFPVSKDKKPKVKSWKQYQEKRASIDEIKIWFSDPTNNIAVVTGGISKIAVVDIDANKQTGELTHAAVDLIKELPPTWHSVTGGGGHHYIYKLTKPFNSHIRIMDGVDIKAKGGYIILPPSVHESGKQYEFLIEPWVEPIAEFPYQLFEDKLNTNGKVLIEAKDWSAPVIEGNRNQELASYVGKLLNKHPEKDWDSFCFPTVLAWNKQVNKPPLPDEEVKVTFESISRYHKNKDVSEQSNLVVEAPEKIDVSVFKPLSIPDLTDILGLTIKKDEENKLITYFAEQSAYTDNAQLNILFNAPSSSGKSYIPTEIAQLFPQEDVIEIGHCSPTAFFHDRGIYNKEKNEIVVDLSRKILIFLDQPHTLLLQHLRSLLSHDKKEVRLKITDKSQKAGLRTKNVVLKGFPAVIFCTAGLKIDEQESTRFILLSPETSTEKIRTAIHEKIKKETNSGAYRLWLEEKPERKLLKERIRAIKQENIQDVRISSPEKVKELFFTQDKTLKPRHTRDIGRILSLVKSIALLNLWFRERDGSCIIANEQDIQDAFNIWNRISISQELNLPPYVYEIYKDVVLAAFNEKNKVIAGIGLTRTEIAQKHFHVYGRPISEWLLRQNIIPMLENAGLITQEPDQNDKRKMLVYPTTHHTISVQKNNSVMGCEVADKAGGIPIT